MQNTKMQYLALAACALLIIPASAFAQTSSVQQNQTTGQDAYLNATLARITCEANFDTGYANTVINDITNINQTKISSDSSKINTDLQTLTSDSNNKNSEQLKIDLKSFRIDSKAISIDIRAAVKNSTPSSDQKNALKSDLSNLKETLRSCMFGTREQLANARITAYGNAILKIQNRTNNLGSRGVDVTHLNELIHQAQTNLGNLSGTISSATNSSQLKSALHSYCQYNGCKNGTNFHFAAQSTLAAEQGMLDKIKTNPNAGQYTSQIDQAQTDLTNAQGILSTVNTDKYQTSQQTDVWNALHDAHNIIKQLWSELNVHAHKRASSSTSSPGSTNE